MVHLSEQLYSVLPQTLVLPLQLSQLLEYLLGKLRGVREGLSQAFVLGLELPHLRATSMALLEPLVLLLDSGHLQQKGTVLPHLVVQHLPERAIVVLLKGSPQLVEGALVGAGLGDVGGCVFLIAVDVFSELLQKVRVDALDFPDG